VRAQGFAAINHLSGGIRGSDAAGREVVNPLGAVPGEDAQAEPTIAVYLFTDASPGPGRARGQVTGGSFLSRLPTLRCVAP
jgi:hypothetical protein